MRNKLSVSTLIFFVSFAAGCGGSAVKSANAGNKNAVVTTANSPAAANAPSADLPVGISTTPISPAANASNKSAAKPTTTPGIPSAEQLKKQAKPGTTPTPGIPSADEMRKAFSKPASNANTASPPMMKEVPMMKSNRKPEKP